MTNENTQHTVFTMAPTTKSISYVAQGLLLNSKKEILEKMSLPAKAEFEERIGFFHEEMTRILLDWMAAGRIDDIRDLLSSLKGVLSEESDNPYFIDDSPLNLQITGRLTVICQVMIVLLRTTNLSKYLGQLAGQRRSAWRDLLIAMYKEDRPLTANDALDLVSTIKLRSTIQNVLKKLVEIGLLGKTKHKKNKVLHHLTLPGREVAMALIDMHFDEREDTQSYPSSCKIIPFPRPSKSGLYNARNFNCA